MNKKEIYEFLDKENVSYEITEHKPLNSMEDAYSLDLPNTDCYAKNLFVRDDKKRNYYLISMKGDKKIDLKTFRKNNNTRALSFASDKDLYKYMELLPGSVTPFGLLNDSECKVEFFIDEEFFADEGIIAIHPNENTSTVWLKVDDLVKIVEKHGNKIRRFKIND